MSERKNLTIIEVKPIKKIGDKQIPKLSFRASDGERELEYHTFRSSLFDAVKAGEAIDADIEIKTREWEGETYTDRRVVQIYVDGQPLGGKKSGQFYRGKSPEELELSARAYALSYSKDLAVAERIDLDQIVLYAEDFYNWLKGDKSDTSSPEEKTVSRARVKSDGDFKNPGEFYTACLKQLKLSKSKVDAELVNFDLADPEQRQRAWETITAIYGHKVEQ